MGFKGKGEWPPTRVREGECTGSTMRLMSCAASSQRLTTTRSSRSMKLCRWRRFTSTPSPSFSKVQCPPPLPPAAAAAAVITTSPTTPARQSVTLCSRPPLVMTGWRTGPLSLPQPAEQRTLRPFQVAAYLCTSAGCPSVPPSTKVRFPLELKKRCVPRLLRHLLGRAVRSLQMGGKRLPGATESFPRTPTSVTRMK